jgi:hypothetical protein
VARARRVRQQLGGGMRQAGVIAAPGLVALETMIPRLAEDHANAALLGDALARCPGVRVAPVPGRKWLVVLEAHYENNLAEQEYSFGQMLKAFFARTPEVQVRHRFFHDLGPQQHFVPGLEIRGRPGGKLGCGHRRWRGRVAVRCPALARRTAGTPA